MKQHSDDYKLSAVMYYINHNEDLRDTCDIFKCKYQSLHRWIKRYKLQGNISRKTRKNHNAFGIKHIKITPEIERFIKEHVPKAQNVVRYMSVASIPLVCKYSTTTLWELSKLVNEQFKIHLTFVATGFLAKSPTKNFVTTFSKSCLNKHKITRKRLRSEYYPEKREGQEATDLCQRHIL